MRSQMNANSRNIAVTLKPYFRYVLCALKDCKFCEWVVARKALFAICYFGADLQITRLYYLLMHKTYDMQSREIKKSIILTGLHFCGGKSYQRYSALSRESIDPLFAKIGEVTPTHYGYLKQ